MLVWTIVAKGAMTLPEGLALGPGWIESEAVFASQEIVEGEGERLGRWRT